MRGHSSPPLALLRARHVLQEHTNRIPVQEHATVVMLILTLNRLLKFVLTVLSTHFLLGTVPYVHVFPGSRALTVPHALLAMWVHSSRLLAPRLAHHVVQEHTKMPLVLGSVYHVV